MNLSPYLQTPQPWLDRAARHVCVALIFVIPLSTAATSLMRALLLLTWLLAGGFIARWRALKDAPIAWVAVALLVWVVAGMGYTSATPDAALAHLSKYSKLLFVPIALSLMTEKPWRDRALDAFAAAMTLTLAASLLHSVWAFPGAKATEDGALANHYIFTNYIQQNVMMSFFALLCLVRGFWGTVPLRRGLWLTLAALAIADIVFLVGGRTGYLTLAANLLVFALLATPRRHRLFAVAGLLIVAAALYAASPKLQQRIAQATQEVQTRAEDGAQTSSGLRIGFWTGSARLIAQHPWLGTGTASYQTEFCRVAITPQWCGHPANGHPHNQPLHSWVENGLPGALLVMALILLPPWVARRADAPTRLLITGFAATFLVHSLLNASIFHIEGYFFLLMLAALMPADEERGGHDVAARASPR